MALFGRRHELPTADSALTGRAEPLAVPAEHVVSGHRVVPPFPDGLQTAEFALGCFWGAEKLFWELPGVYSTAAGYAGGFTPNPTYEEVCSGRTGHAEAVLVVFDPARVTYAGLLQVFWENHDPTQGFRQGNDVGTQYRSVIFHVNEGQRVLAEQSRKEFGKRLANAGFGSVTTQVTPAGDFYYAEEYHQQYLFKVPNGYCPVHSTGVGCPAGIFATE